MIDDDIEWKSHRWRSRELQPQPHGRVYTFALRIASRWTLGHSILLCVAIWAAGVYAGIALWRWLVS